MVVVKEVVVLRGGGSSVVTMGARRCFEDQPTAVDRSV